MKRMILESNLVKTSYFAIGDDSGKKKIFARYPVRRPQQRGRFNCLYFFQDIHFKNSIQFRMNMRWKKTFFRIWRLKPLKSLQKKYGNINFHFRLFPKVCLRSLSIGNSWPCNARTLDDADFPNKISIGKKLEEKGPFPLSLQSFFIRKLE